MWLVKTKKTTWIKCWITSYVILLYHPQTRLVRPLILKTYILFFSIALHIYSRITFNRHNKAHFPRRKMRTKHDELVSRLAHDPWSVTRGHTHTHTSTNRPQVLCQWTKKAWFLCLHWPQCDLTVCLFRKCHRSVTRRLNLMSFTVYHWLIRGLCICSLTWHWSTVPVRWREPPVCTFTIEPFDQSRSSSTHFILFPLLEVRQND